MYIDDMKKIIEPIAHFRSPFSSKFGVPRQSGIVEDLKGQIVFCGEYRNPDALRGMDDFDYLWLIWGFSANADSRAVTVRPPLLGGNRRMGVFATRASFRPNGLALSSVKIERIELDTPSGPVIHVLGADLMDGTPIYDIKPYLPYADCKPEATGGFAPGPDETLCVNFPAELLAKVPEHLREGAVGVLAQDPRPPYQHDPTRVYGFRFGPVELKFTVDGGVLTVRAVL